MGKNILVITSSPRREGNSDMLADAFINGAQSAGHTVVKYESAFTNISGCRACDTCWKKGVPCSYHDDFNVRFAPVLEKAHTIVFAMPVHFYGFPASLQATLEKSYSFLVPQSPANLKVSETVLLVCGEAEEDEAYKGVIEAYKNISILFKAKDRGIIVASGLMEKGSIQGTKYLKKARVLGEKM